jgi:hypothetical protein
VAEKVKDPRACSDAREAGAWRGAGYGAVGVGALGARIGTPAGVAGALAGALIGASVGAVFGALVGYRVGGLQSDACRPPRSE